MKTKQKKSPKQLSKHSKKTSAKKTKVKGAKTRAQQILNRYNMHQTTRVFVAGGSRSGNNPDYAKEAFLLGKAIGKRDYQLTFGLSSRGIMGAVAQGVLASWNKKDKKLPKPIQGITT